MAYTGEMRLVAFGFAPRGWARCDGQLLPINQNQALFSLLGTMYGGDGRTTFALPDMRGRVGLGFGTGNGLTPRTQGAQLGQETVTLGQQHLPRHRHAVRENPAAGTLTSPAKNVPAGGGRYAAAPNGTVMDANMVRPVGGDQPHDNVQPVLALTYIICLSGIFPSQS